MIRLFVLPRFSGRPIIRLLDPKQESLQKEGRLLFKEPPQDFAYTVTEIVEAPQDADFLVVPQQIQSVTPEVNEYLDSACALARENRKRILLFISGDFSHNVHVDRPEVVAFKGSGYRTDLRENEVIFAPFVGDLNPETVSSRQKGAKPIVGFCGYAGFASWNARLKYFLWNLYFDLMQKPAYKRGIYFRRKAMRSLEVDSRIETNFIVRDSFSGNLTTISNDPTRLRQEYVQNLIESDFVLCPKGDANYSSRFYEALSLGRIPILIDTDVVLPFEGTLDYSKFIVRVPYQEVERVGEYVASLWSRLSNEEFVAMQKAGQEAFRTNLRFDAYVNRALPLLKEGGVAAVL